MAPGGQPSLQVPRGPGTRPLLIVPSVTSPSQNGNRYKSTRAFSETAKRPSPDGRIWKVFSLSSKEVDRPEPPHPVSQQLINSALIKGPKLAEASAQLAGTERKEGVVCTWPRWGIRALGLPSSLLKPMCTPHPASYSA